MHPFHTCQYSLPLTLTPRVSSAFFFRFFHPIFDSKANAYARTNARSSADDLADDDGLKRNSLEI